MDLLPGCACRSVYDMINNHKRADVAGANTQEICWARLLAERPPAVPTLKSVQKEEDPINKY